MKVAVSNGLAWWRPRTKQKSDPCPVKFSDAVAETGYLLVFLLFICRPDAQLWRARRYIDVLVYLKVYASVVYIHHPCPPTCVIRPFFLLNFLLNFFRILPFTNWQHTFSSIMHSPCHIPLHGVYNGAETRR